MRIQFQKLKKLTKIWSREKLAQTHDRNTEKKNTFRLLNVAQSTWNIGAMNKANKENCKHICYSRNFNVGIYHSVSKGNARPKNESLL